MPPGPGGIFEAYVEDQRLPGGLPRYFSNFGVGMAASNARSP